MYKPLVLNKKEAFLNVTEMKRYDNVQTGLDNSRETHLDLYLRISLRMIKLKLHKKSCKAPPN